MRAGAGSSGALRAQGSCRAGLAHGCSSFPKELRSLDFSMKALDMYILVETLKKKGVLSCV